MTNHVLSVRGCHIPFFYDGNNAQRKTKNIYHREHRENNTTVVGARHGVPTVRARHAAPDVGAATRGCPYCHSRAGGNPVLIIPQLLIQIIPVGIHAFNQPQLPLAPPFFQLFFALCRAFYTVGLFIIDEFYNVVFFCEALEKFVFMFVNAAREVVGDADI